MSSTHSRRAHFLAILVTAALALAPAALFASEPTGAFTVEPTVPRPLTTNPCVVTVYSSTELIAFDSMPFEMPADCPPPWSKIVFEADLTSLARTNSVANMRIEMHDNVSNGSWILYMGAPQIHAGTPSWRVERDLTDYAALFRASGEWSIELNHDWDNASPSFVEDSATGDVRLVFYPQSVANPAPRVPDGVYAQDLLQTLPRNIIKAYVEVLAQGLDEADLSNSSDRFWYTCMPTAAIATYPALRNQFALGDDWGASLTSTPQGCNGGSFREAEVWLDDTLFLGIAPIYPWLPSNFHVNIHNTLDQPVPSAQGLNFIPYRLDVTPFAAKLNDGVAHRLTVRVVGDTGPRPVHVRTEGKLFVYRDPKRSIVPGRITRNTLVHATPTVSRTFSFPAPDGLTGTIGTQDSRKMEVVGFLDTSAGRVFSAVYAETYFNNQQSVGVDGLTFPGYRGYSLLLGLDSNVVQASARLLGGVVLERNVTRVNYPLRLGYILTGAMVDPLGEGYVTKPDNGRVVADQTRLQITDQWLGTTHFVTAVRDHFAGRHSRVYPGAHFDWASQRDYVFLDSSGGCYTAARGTISGVLTGSTTGVGCPGGVNNNAWYTRPDGSTENMGWAP